MGDRKTAMPKLTFLSTGETFAVPAETELIKAYTINPKIPLKFGCTLGNCGVCVIKVASGQQSLSRTTKQEKLILKNKCQDGYRLACQCALYGDIEIA